MLGSNCQNNEVKNQKIILNLQSSIMNHVLFVTDTYYPDSSATTTLGRRTAEALAQLGYSVDVYPAEISGNHFTYLDEYNGVRIISPEAGADMNYSPVNPSETHTITQSHLSGLRRILDAKAYDYVFSVALAFEIHFLVHQVLSSVGEPVEPQPSNLTHKPSTLNPQPSNGFRCRMTRMLSIRIYRKNRNRSIFVRRLRRCEMLPKYSSLRNSVMIMSVRP